MTQMELIESVQKAATVIKTQQELIDLLYIQVVDLSMMSKIELGDDVISEIKRLKGLLNGEKNLQNVWVSLKLVKMYGLLGYINKNKPYNENILCISSD